MRRNVLVAAIIGSAAAAIIAGGLYLARQGPGETAQPPQPAVAGTASANGPFSFPLLETPQAIPDLAFLDSQARETSLEAFEGQTVLLNIWATWCVPCREEMPSLERLQARLGGPDFQVVALSIDREGLPAVKAFYAELGLAALDMYADPTGKTSRDLGVFGIPTTLLIGPSGRELGRLVGPAEWDSDEAVSLIGKMLLFATGGECDCPMGRHETAMPDS